MIRNLNNLDGAILIHIDKLIAQWLNKLKDIICAEIQLDHRWKFNKDGMQW